ncbi:DUF1566 domain-containing protein [Chloroflexota bacterium]
MLHLKTRILNPKVLGWVAVGLSTAVASFWAWWGISENFHEGWYYESLTQNLSLMFVQYLSIAFIFVLLTVVAIRWRRVGSAFLTIAVVGLVLFFSGFGVAASVLIIPPLLIIGVLFWFGRPDPKRFAASIVIIIPVIIIIGFGIPSGIRVSQRLNDENLNARLIEENGLELIWAPSGPGWPDSGVPWDEANEICRYLSEDGLVVEDTAQNYWRLPTTDEVVGSMMLHGVNAEGIWDSENSKATYAIKPDKETPLWNPYSQIIYYWTSSELNEDRAYIVVYDGQVFTRNKAGMGSLGFRAVKSPED